MSKRVTVRINQSTGIHLETLKINSMTGVYISTSNGKTRYFVVYTNIWGSQALETTKSDYRLLVGVIDVPELNI